MSARPPARDQDLFSAAFAAVAAGVCLVDDTGRLIDVNPALCAMLGFAREELAGESLSRILPEALGASPKRSLDALHRQSSRAAVEWALRRRDGTPVAALANFRTAEVPGAARMLVVTFAQRERGIAEMERFEKRYQQVFDHATEGIVVVQDGRFAFANPAALALLDRRGEEVVGHAFLEFVHEADRSAVAERHARRLRGDRVEPRYQFRASRGNGESIWIELSAVLLDWDGKPATLCFFSDVSERRRLEEQVAESLVERETILENLIVGIAFLDSHGRLRWANGATLRIFGVGERDMLVGRSLEAFYPSREAYLEVGSAVSAAILAGRAFQREIPMRRGDGTLFWALLAGKAVYEGDLSQGTVWTVIDISRRKALEEELRRASAEREALLQNTVVGITHTHERRHLWVNRKFTEMTGYAEKELMGASSRLIFTDDESWQRFGALAYPVLSRGEPFSIEWQIRRKDGSTFWAEFFGRAVDPTDFSRGTIWTFVDISARKEKRAG
jgi:PAS domain S-box-containing protein